MNREGSRRARSSRQVPLRAEAIQPWIVKLGPWPEGKRLCQLKHLDGPPGARSASTGGLRGPSCSSTRRGQSGKRVGSWLPAPFQVGIDHGTWQTRPTSQLGLSQAELARRAGMPRSVVNAYVQGSREPGADALARLAAAGGLELQLGRPASRPSTPSAPGGSSSRCSSWRRRCPSGQGPSLTIPGLPIACAKKLAA